MLNALFGLTYLTVLLDQPKSKPTRVFVGTRYGVDHYATYNDPKQYREFWAAFREQMIFELEDLVIASRSKVEQVTSQRDEMRTRRGKTATLQAIAYETTRKLHHAHLHTAEFWLAELRAAMPTGDGKHTYFTKISSRSPKKHPFPDVPSMMRLKAIILGGNGFVVENMHGLALTSN